MSVTFDSVALANPSESNVDIIVKTNEITLISGKNSVQTTDETYIKATFKCVTQNYTDVTSLIAKIGSKASLAIGSITYTDCAITAFKVFEVIPNTWEYEVSFTQDTS